jgi:hypothetical protein
MVSAGSWNDAEWGAAPDLEEFALLKGERNPGRKNRGNPWERATYARLTTGVSARKKPAIVAAARRLLMRCWAMLRDGVPWRPDPAVAPASGKSGGRSIGRSDAGSVPVSPERNGSAGAAPVSPEDGRTSGGRGGYAPEESRRRGSRES